MKISGNTILVTGGSSGIGRALAEALHERGNQVIVTGRRQELLDEICAQRPGMAGFRLDLDSPSSLEVLKRTVSKNFPDLNVVVANAGISITEDLHGDNWNLDYTQAIVETNIMGVLRTIAAFLPVLTSKTNATIMATSSALAFVPRADFPTYCASKAFLHSWLQSARHQLRNIPIEVLELSPPYVQTELTGAQQKSDQRAMPLPDYIAEVMRMLETGDHPNGELVLARDHARRFADRQGRYDEVYAMLNQS